MPAGVIAAIGAVTAVAGSYAQLREQKKAAALSREQQAVATRRSRRQAIRAGQIQRAQAVASAQAAGSLSSSGALGGIGALSSQVGSELGYSTQMSGLSAQIGQAQSKANTYGAAAGLGGALFNFGMNGNSLFRGQPKPPSAASVTGAGGGGVLSAFAPSSSLRPKSRNIYNPYAIGATGAF